MTRIRAAALIAVFAVAATLILREAVAAESTFDLDDGFVVKDPGRFEWQFGGRVHADTAWYDDDITPLDDDAELRRARLRTQLTLLDAWRFKAEYDVGGVVDGWKTVYVQYRGLDNWRFTFGNQVVPFSLADVTSSNVGVFMERPLATALAPGLLTGLAVKRSSETWSLSGGIFGDELEDQERRESDGEGVAGRATKTLWSKDRSLLHLGGSLEYREPSADDAVRIRNRPESYMTDRRLVDTRVINDVDDTLTGGLESAWVSGPFALRGEYIHARVTRGQGSDLDFAGWYATASYVLTGERVRFSKRNGVFRPLKPRRKWGALEVGLRYSTLDLEDGDVTGGEQTNVGVAFNWYLNQNMRIMANFIAYDASPNRNGLDEDGNIFQLRFQGVL